MAKQLNVPDIHLYEIDIIDADGNPKKLAGRGVKGLRTEEDFLDHLRRHPAALNDERGRKPKRFVGIRKLPPQEAASRPLPAGLPPGLEKNIKADEGGPPTVAAEATDA